MLVLLLETLTILKFFRWSRARIDAAVFTCLQAANAATDAS